MNFACSKQEVAAKVNSTLLVENLHYTNLFSPIGSPVSEKTKATERPRVHNLALTVGGKIIFCFSEGIVVGRGIYIENPATKQ